MGRVIEADDWDDWYALFEFRQSAYRLETLQTYAEPEEAEAVARFLATGEARLDTSWWESLIRRQRDAGRTATRVRVLVEPFSDYTRFETLCFLRFVEAGEDIRVIPTTAENWPPGIPSRDYWLFDDRDVWAMHYSEAGPFVRAELLDDPAVIAEHLRWRDVALAQAVPLRDYLASRAESQTS
ncbi:MAG: hypothetical protein DLM59_02380 [Pseudonocardiales bacterium]|nr:MAG: hypothetical protein DLM59_02380 [Pseudonocardiales bacterium]